MAHINKTRNNTRLEIIKVAARLFIEEGYSKTTFARVARELDISTGNITFYFPSKEHLLVVLADELFDFQSWLMDYEAKEGASSLLSYCLELTSIAAACEEDEITRDFFVSIYSSRMILGRIRENDVEKTKKIFAAYRPDWSDEEWRVTENVVSGIEYATIMTCDLDAPLSVRVGKTIDSILMLYGVPEELRKQKIDRVLNMDYRALGRRILGEFKNYVEKINEEALEQAQKGKERPR